MDPHRSAKELTTTLTRMTSKMNPHTSRCLFMLRTMPHLDPEANLEMNAVDLLLPVGTISFDVNVPDRLCKSPPRRPREQLGDAFRVKNELKLSFRHLCKERRHLITPLLVYLLRALTGLNSFLSRAHYRQTRTHCIRIRTPKRHPANQGE